MQIVIDIPEEEYQNYLKMRPAYPEGVFCYIKAIQNGTPLPKGHGDLIDKNEIIKRYEKDCGRRIYVDNFIHDIELNMTTIIEADKEKEDEQI